MLATWEWLSIACVILIAAWFLATRFFGLNMTTYPTDPTLAFTQSFYLSPRSLHRLRFLVALFFMGLLVYDLTHSWENGYWLIYLTHWALFVETVYVVMLWRVNAYMLKLFQQMDGIVFEQLSQNDVAKSTPAIVKVVMVAHSIALPVCLLVTIIYWTALNPVWDICELNGDAPHCTPFPRDTSIFVHFVNTVVLLGMFSLGELPFTAKNGGWVLVFCGVYGVWTIIHFFLKIGTYSKCKTHPRDECPIYSIIDWHNPGSTLIVIAGLTFILAPLVNFTVIGIGKLRDEMKIP
eukprot:TRINITY_DN14995_c0_g1_i1.p1 TRINITY_DN14995_c0_g1~~TRINITY_DN14995_c0_g1_i1.p1  ORF type:complete len:293 (+),score=25.85 TRINITY_DN14995_c0_g1_i1:53-931(+)